MARLLVISAGILLLGLLLLPGACLGQPTPSGMNFAFGQQAFDKGRTREAIQYFRHALIEAENDGQGEAEIARCLDALADAEHLERQNVDAEAHRLRSLTLLEKAYGKDDPRITQALASLATFYRNRNMYALARQYHDRAVAILERSYGADSQQVALKILNIADYDYYHSPDQSTFAEELYARGLPILEKHDPEGKTFYHIYVGNYADCNAYKGDQLMPELLLTKLIARQEQLAGFGDPMYFEMLCWWADQCLNTERYALAEEYYQRAWDVQKQYGVKDLREPVDIMFKLLQVYNAQRKKVDAERMQQTILASIDQVKLIAPRDLVGCFYQSGNTLFEHKRYTQAKALYAGAAAIMEKAYGPASTQLLQPLGKVAFTDDLLGRNKESAALKTRLLKIVTDAPAPRDTDLASDMRDLTSWVISQQGDLLDTSFLERLLTVVTAKYRGKSGLAVTALGMLADAYQMLHLKIEVESLYVETIEAAILVYGPADMQVVRSLLTLANWQKSNERNEEADWTVVQAVTVLKNTKGLDDLHVAERYSNGAEILWEHEPSQAGALFQQALTLYEKRYGPDDPHLASVLFTVTNVCGSSDCSTLDVNACWKRYLDIQQKTLGATQRDWVDVLPSAISYYARIEQSEEGEQCRRKLLAIDESTFGADDVRILPNLEQLRDLLEAQGKAKEVESLIQRELEVREKAMGKNHPSLASPLQKLADIHAGAGQVVKAKEEVIRALALAESAFWEGDSRIIHLLKKYASLLSSVMLTQEAEQVNKRLNTLAIRYPELSESIRGLE
ncbi:MAG: tetratricopeptide repeat protein [Armatimonadota bacterium]